MASLHILTDKAIKAARSRSERTGKQVRLSDGGWLTLLCRPDGAAYWQQRYRFGGKARQASFGAYPKVSLADARDRAKEARDLLAKGIDPVEHRRVEKAAQRQFVDNTFGAAAEAWFKYNTPRWATATAEKARQYLDKDLLPPLGKRPLANITAPDLGEVIARIELRGAMNVAKKARQWCNAIFKYSIARGWITSNPAKHLAAVAAYNPPASNYPHLEEGALPDLLRALDAFTGSPLTLGAIRLALWTANRPGVTRTLRWSELDLDAGLWTIEKGREGMKRGYSHMTPLPCQAVAMLRELHQLTGTFDYVFAGRNDPRRPLSGNTVNKALAAMGFKGQQTAHGFRHLVSTALNERGYDPDHVERQLAHGDPDAIRGTYNKAQYLEPRRQMMQEWADLLDAIRSGKDNVTPIKRKTG
jgi:integrase